MNKHTAFSIILCFTFIFSKAQNVGIGTTDPKARLHVADSNVLFSATGLANSTPGDPPVSGTGRRMMWYADKGAFRAGYAATDSWDKTMTGNYSFASGYGNIAAGEASTAMGTYNIAYGTGATAVGSSSSAYGWYSLALGNSLAARSLFETVVGNYNHHYTPAGGNNLWSATDRIFSVGIGTSEVTRNNALTILKNGNTGIGTPVPVARLQVVDSNVVFSAFGTANLSPGVTPISGPGRRMMWYADKAAFRAGYIDGNGWDRDDVGFYSFAGGFASSASGLGSTALGYRCTAIGSSSFAGGQACTTSGFASIAFGNGNNANGSTSLATGYLTNAIGNSSVAMNIYTVATGDFATAMGAATTAKAYGSLVIGRFNDSIAGANEGVWVDTDPVFIIGNGDNNVTRRNAVTVLKNGNTNVNAYLRIGRAASGNADFSGLETGWGVSGKQADAGKIQYGGFGGATHTLNIVGAGTNALGGDRVIKLWSEGGMRIRGNTLPDADNGYSLGQSSLRWSTVWAANGVIQTSDARLKTNIASLGYGLKELMQMQPVQYNWKENPSDKKEIGFLAQDIQKIIPEAVEAPANGDAMGMKYTELIPVLVKAIQEQQKQIEELKSLLREKVR